MRPAVIDKRLGGVDSYDLGSSRPVQNALNQRPSAAADIQDLVGVADSYEIEEKGQPDACSNGPSSPHRRPRSQTSAPCVLSLSTLRRLTSRMTRREAVGVDAVVSGHSSSDAARPRDCAHGEAQRVQRHVPAVQRRR